MITKVYLINWVILQIKKHNKKYKYYDFFSRDNDKVNKLLYELYYTIPCRF